MKDYNDTLQDRIYELQTLVMEMERWVQFHITETQRIFSSHLFNEQLVSSGYHWTVANTCSEILWNWRGCTGSHKVYSLVLMVPASSYTVT